MIIPCFNDGRYIRETVASIREPEEIAVVVVDDCSTDPATLDCYRALETRGVRVIRHEANRGQGAARNTGLSVTTTPYVFNLDSDDLLLPGVLSRLASLLDAHPEADAAYGDYEEFGASEGVRRTARTLDPYRVAHVNKSPGLAMFRREALERVGGWSTARGYEDWDLWMTFAEQGREVVHSGEVVFRYRVDPGRSFGGHRADHTEIYRRLKERHPGLFSELGRHRRKSSLPFHWRMAYPLLYVGGRPRLEGARRAVRRVAPSWVPGS
ncbi:glycosyltransferase family 2 protein [Geodermatophilus sp. SYSU D00684]